MSGYELSKQLRESLKKYISGSADIKKALEEAGVSVGFFTNYICENIQEIMYGLIPEAAQMGELTCFQCGNGEYYNYKNTPLPANENGEFICPDCGSLLRSCSCAACGSHIESYPLHNSSECTEPTNSGNYSNGRFICINCSKIQLTAAQENALKKISYDLRRSESEIMGCALDHYLTSWYGMNYRPR